MWLRKLFSKVVVLWLFLLIWVFRLVGLKLIFFRDGMLCVSG